MKKALIFVISLSFTTAMFAQKKAVTETGDEVILYDDGSWKYQSGDIKEKKISVNSKKFTKPKSSTFLLKSDRTNIGVWLDPKKWSFKKGAADADAEYELQMKGEDLYGMMISEKVEIPLESLKNIAVQNAQAVSPDIKIVDQEYRTVNGLKVLLLQMDGTIQGIKFSYYGYYYTSPKGTVQFLTYTSQTLLKGYKADCEDLLNGLSVIKK